LYSGVGRGVAAVRYTELQTDDPAAIDTGSMENLVVVEVQADRVDVQAVRVGPGILVVGPVTVVVGPSTVVVGPSTVVVGPRTVAVGPVTVVVGPSTVVVGPSTVVLGPKTVVVGPSAVIVFPGAVVVTVLVVGTAATGGRGGAAGGTLHCPGFAGPPKSPTRGGSPTITLMGLVKQNRG